jgi:hypothetical protein
MPTPSANSSADSLPPSTVEVQFALSLSMNDLKGRYEKSRDAFGMF